MGSNALNTPSFTNTPQAGDDTYSWTQDSILLNTSYVAATNTVTLDVMSNDLGGNAKKLFSIDDGGTGTFLNDLKTNNVNTGWETTAHGNQIRIFNGDIQFSFDHELFATTGSHDIKSLAAGQTITDSFVYAIQLGNGALSWATVNFSLTGLNDGPTVSAHDDGTVKEDVNAVSDNPNTTGVIETGSYLTTTGAIKFADPDSADHHSVTVATDAGNTLGGSLIVAVTTDSTGNITGTVTWTYAVNDDATDYLAEGQQVTEKFTVTIDDGQGGTVDQLITVTITGTNEAPVISVVGADADSASFNEGNSPLSTNGTLTVNDVDTLDTVAVSTTHATGAVSSGYDIETHQGLNEAALLAMFSVEPNTSLSADTGDSHNVTWSFDSTPQAFDFLQVGEDLTLTFTVQAQDNSGTGTSITTHDVTFTIHGTNDAAAFSGDETGSVTEDATLTTGGTLQVADADHDQSAFDHTSSLTGTYGDFTFNIASGQWTYDLRNSDANVQALNTGDQKTDILTVYSVDGSHQDITVTINGANELVTNHAPVATDDHWIISQGTLASLPIAALIGNDSDSDGNSLSVTGLSTNGSTWVTDSSDGTIDGVIHLGAVAVDTVNGTISYNQPGGATGDTLFYYRIDDGHGATDVGQTTVTAVTIGQGTTANDTIDLSSATYDYSYINSSAGNDKVTGGTAIDTFLGGNGDDTLTGGPGNDTLTGNAGHDHFVFNGTNGGLDAITDFTLTGPNSDILDFNHLAFGNLDVGGIGSGTLDSSHFVSNSTGTATAPAGTAQFVYDTTSHVLSFDPDGSGAAAAIQLAIVENAGAGVALSSTNIHII